jgi:adenosylmethionine-8-amino-7-oxononanoate aminotransferase
MQNIDQRAESIWYPFSSIKGGYPVLEVSSAEKEFLYLKNGNALIDGISSWWVNIHGHSHPEIAEAVYMQALKLEHVIFSGFTHAPAKSLADSLIRILPNHSKKIFFSDNGSTSIEVALKMGIQLFFNQGRKKVRIVAVQGAYHGDTFGAMAVGERDAFTTPFQDLFFEVSFLPFPCGLDASRGLELLENWVNEGDPLIFIYEPLVQGASGMRMYPAEWMNKALEITYRDFCIRIADEVFTGFGRTGSLFASSQCKQQPDIICLSKAITGGFFPLGATACNEKIVSAFDFEDFTTSFLHGHSFTGNPMIIASANKSLEILLRNDTQALIEKLCHAQQNFQKELIELGLGEHPRVLGTILALEARGGNGSGYFNSQREAIYHFFLNRGILLRPLGRTIYFVPPYITSSESINKVHQAIKEYLGS